MRNHLPDSAWEILAVIDEAKSHRMICDELGMNYRTARYALSRLVQVGCLRMRGCIRDMRVIYYYRVGEAAQSTG